MAKRVCFMMMTAACLLNVHAETVDLGPICQRFSGFDLNEDGTAEIEHLDVLALPDVTPQPEAPTIIVIVEERLLQPSPEPGVALPDLQPSIQTLGTDLANEGWNVAAVSARVYAGERHQDGRTLLALRRFLQAVKEAQPTLAGALMIGSFPEAFLVRNYNWRKHEPLTLHGGKENEKVFAEAVPFLRTFPEPVADRSELILCDLEGNWEQVYVEPKERLKTVIGVYPDGVPERGGVCEDFELGSVTFEDFFYINDGRCDIREIMAEEPGEDGKPVSRVAALDIEILDEYENAECSPKDRQRANPMSCPTIMVSRINALHSALRPKTSVVGTDGKGLLDDEGKPRTVAFATEEDVPRWINVWERDPILERQLLIDYFARNHTFRTGGFAEHCNPASIGHGLGDGFADVCGTLPDWDAFEDARYHGSPQASLLDYAEWLKLPAALRDVQAHSDPWGSTFGEPDMEKLLAAVGGQAWTWSAQGNALVPSLDAACKKGKADFALYRTMWENKVLPSAGSLYMHTGCQGISPAGAGHLPYSDPEYGYWQGAEALLFFTDGLALVGRAKVFYDAPRDFYECLGKGDTFGHAWAHYFEVESQAQNADDVGGGIGRKRAYFWSVLGDWSLRLRAAEARP